MILPPGIPGVAFGDLSDGDPRSDLDARRRVCDELGIPEDWAFVRQVHGRDVATAVDAGDLGDADGILTFSSMLPVAVTTADCVPVVLRSERATAVVHAGWRGVAKGIVPIAAEALSVGGDRVLYGIIGPHIGPCCYEVGPEVVDAIGGHGSQTTFGSLSVDLSSAIAASIPDVPLTEMGMCTMHDPRFASYRQNATDERQVTVAWNQ